MNTKHFAITHSNTPWLTFDVGDIDEKGLISPILWCNQGEFCIIPDAVVKNLIDSAEMYAKLSGKRISPKLTVAWSQGIPISNQAGRALIGE